MRTPRPPFNRSLRFGLPTLALLGALLTTTALEAQSRDGFPTLTAEVTVGGSVGKLASAASGMQFDPGPSFSVGALTPLTGPIRGYAAYRRSAFGCSDGFCSGADVELGSHGVAVGAEGTWRVLRGFGGLVYHQGRTEWDWEDARAGPDGGDGSARSEWSVGFEAGVGLEFDLRRGITLAPAVRYARFGSSFPDSPHEPDADGDVMSQFGLDVGLRAPVPGVGR